MKKKGAIVLTSMVFIVASFSFLIFEANAQELYSITAGAATFHNHSDNPGEENTSWVRFVNGGASGACDVLSVGDKVKITNTQNNNGVFKIVEQNCFDTFPFDFYDLYIDIDVVGRFTDESATNNPTFTDYPYILSGYEAKAIAKNSLRDIGLVVVGFLSGTLFILIIALLAISYGVVTLRNKITGKPF